VRSIRFVDGDATSPSGASPQIIVHVCNDRGKWGKGFVLAISRRWREPERAYKAGFETATPLALGDVQFVPVTPAIVVANLIGQHGIANRTSKTPPIRYDAIRRGLAKVGQQALASGASVHMPRIGCGLAGGQWDRIEPIILETLSAADIDVTVYDFGSS
jgi:O-acetyl-ADP-ribose deacetylase (regulator of RNase III)